MHLLLEWILYAVGLLIAAHLIPGFKVKSFGSAMIAALVIGLLNVTLGWVLHIVAFPINFVTFWIFAGLVALLINAVVIRVAGSITPDFRVDGFLPALLGAIVLEVLQFLFAHVLRL